jgi:hypothetical protein
MPVTGGDVPAYGHGRVATGWRRDRAVVVSLLVVCAVPMLVLAWLRYRLHFPSGDEPHYLIISEALGRYHSLDVQRVYDNRDYAGFYPWPIEPHTVPGPSGRLLPLHSVGGPVLWLIPFVLWGQAGVLAFMVGVSLLIVANVYWLSRQLRVSRGTAFMVGFAFGVGTPVLTYSSMSFVEPIGALGCVYALRVLHTPRLRTRDLLLVSTSLGVLPWVHSRFLLFPPVFLVLLVFRLRREEGWARRRVWALGPAVGLFLGLELYHLAVWHTLDLAPNQTRAGAVPFQADPVPALAGIVFDQEVGFIPNFPIFLLVLPGILFAASRGWLSLHVHVHVHVTAVVVPYTLMVCSFPAWAGAWSPPARFMAVVLPMLAGYVAVAMQRVRRVVVFALAGSAAVYAGVLTTLAVFTPDGGFSAQSGESPALASLDALTHFDLTRWVPSAAINGQWMIFAAWMAAAIGLGIVLRLLGREQTVHPAGTDRVR